jgi:hypothetical protein
MDSYLELPELGKKFSGALIVDVTYGPRQEFTLACHEQVWEGQNGHYDSGVTYIRFGGVANLDRVKGFFAARPYQSSEVYVIDYAKNHTSKIGQIFVEVSFERTEATIIVECRNISVSHED